MIGLDTYMQTKITAGCKFADLRPYESVTEISFELQNFLSYQLLTDLVDL